MAMLATPAPQTQTRYEKLRDEMALFHSPTTAAAPTFQDVLTYIYRVAAIGPLPGSSWKHTFGTFSLSVLLLYGILLFF